DLPVVERPRAEVVQLRPGLAPVLGAEDAAVLDRAGLAAARLGAGAGAGAVGLDDGVDDARVLAVDGQPAAAVGAVGQALLHLLPGLAAVGGLVEAGARPGLGARVAAGEGVAPHLVGGGVKRVRLGRVDGHVDEAGVLVDELRELPGL